MKESDKLKLIVDDAELRSHDSEVQGEIAKRKKRAEEALQAKV